MTFDVYPIDIRHVNNNYVWAIVPADSSLAYVVDPGAAQPVLNWLKERRLDLAGILITHHHWDHVNGLDELLEQHPVPVWGPATHPLPQVTHKVGEGDSIQLNRLKFEVMEIPGHTQEHIAYYNQDNSQPALFCGDTLFASGCGRVFTGTVEDLHLSLTRLARLPADTQIYCAHEYTLANLQFAQTVEPDNSDIQARMAAVQKLRDGDLPSLPSELREEWATNPFLRSEIPTVAQSASQYAGAELSDSTDVFAALRRWKDNF